VDGMAMMSKKNIITLAKFKGKVAKENKNLPRVLGGSETDYFFVRELIQHNKKRIARARHLQCSMYC